MSKHILRLQTGVKLSGSMASSKFHCVIQRVILGLHLYKWVVLCNMSKFVWSIAIMLWRKLFPRIVHLVPMGGTKRISQVLSKSLKIINLYSRQTDLQSKDSKPKKQCVLECLEPMNNSKIHILLSAWINNHFSLWKILWTIIGQQRRQTLNILNQFVGWAKKNRVQMHKEL